LTNAPTYGMLRSEQVKRVIGISSSVIYEAQWFHKPAFFLKEREQISNLHPVDEDYFFNEVLNEVPDLF
jgi:hypothetical protein